MRAKPLLITLLGALLACSLGGCEQPEQPTHVHEYVTMQAIEPTCTVAGQSDGLKCRTCGYFSEPPKAIPATGHSYSGEWTVDREPTEYRDGEKSLRCLVCGERSAVSPIARLAPSTQGLAYELNQAGNGYVCVGIGTATLAKEIRIPSEHQGLPVTEIGDQAFANNTHIVALSIPASVKTVGRSAFSGCTSLASIDLSDEIEYIASYAFADTACYSNYAMWEDGALYIGKHLIAVQPQAAKGAFAVRQSTQTIAGAAFIRCTALTDVSIPETVVSIGNSAFYGCSAMTDITLPDSIRIIGNGALAYCTSLTEFHLPVGVERILSSPFPGCTALRSITVDEGNACFYSVDNCLIERSTGTLISGCTSSVIPSDGSIKHIGNAAFYECPDLTSLALPEGVETVGTSAFYLCETLQEVSFPSTLTSIDTQAFRDCKSLKQISFSDRLISVGEAAFAYCSALTDVQFSDGIEHIADNAFAYCTNLVHINLPDSLLTLGQGALTSCGSIAYETYGSCLYLGNWLIDVSDTLVTHITLKPTTVGVADSAFSSCQAMTTVQLPASVRYIGSKAFLHCRSLSSITIPEGVEIIGEQTFANCIRLQTLSLPSSVTSIGANALLNCSALTDLYYAGTEQMWEQVTKEDGWKRGTSQLNVVFGR